MESEQKPKKRGRPANAEKAEAKEPKAQKLVKMTRDGVSADVHPAEVDHMKSHGWA